MDGENNGKPQLKMDDLEGKPHYFRKHPFEGSPMILIAICNAQEAGRRMYQLACQLNFSVRVPGSEFCEKKPGSFLERFWMFYVVVDM